MKKAILFCLALVLLAPVAQAGDITNFPGGFPGGVSIRGVPLLSAYGGNVYWVYSTSGSDGNSGTFDRPFASLDYAIGRCTANRGDIIMLKSGHTETVTAAADIVFDIAGVTVIGLGTGEKRPTITFTTAITADIDITAPNVTIYNVKFKNGIDNLTAPIHVAATADDLTLIDIVTEDNNSLYHCDDFIVTTALADRLTINGWEHRAGGGKTGPQTAISIVGGDGHEISNFYIVGDFATAAIENVTTACTNVRIHGGDAFSFIQTNNSADVAITMVTTSTGFIGPKIAARLKDNAANITEAFVMADGNFIGPIEIVNADGEQSLETNIAASTDG